MGACSITQDRLGAGALKTLLPAVTDAIKQCFEELVSGSRDMRYSVGNESEVGKLVRKWRWQTAACEARRITRTESV